VLAAWACVAAAQTPAGLRWNRPIPWPVRLLQAGPGEILLAGSDHGRYLFSLDPRRGETVWRAALPGTPWSPAALAEDLAFLIPHDRSLLCLRLSTGETVWRRTLPEGQGRASPLLLEGRLLTLTREGTLSLWESGEGKLLASTRLLAGPRPGDEFWARPAVARETVYMATRRGRLYMVPLNDLSRPRSQALEIPRPPPWGVEVRADLLSLGDRVYVTTVEGTLACLRGGLRPAWTWSPPSLPPSRSWNGQFLPAAVPDPADSRRLYMSLSDRVMALGADTGQVLWQTRFPEPVASPPAFWEDLLVVATAAPRLQLLWRSTGRPAASLPLPAPVSAGPVVVGDLAVVGFEDGRIQALQLSAPTSPPAPRGGPLP
jgi:outer membrane protein assembly factor BamB